LGHSAFCQWLFDFLDIGNLYPTMLIIPSQVKAKTKKGWVRQWEVSDQKFIESIFVLHENLV
jgi:hypothetical protein